MVTGVGVVVVVAVGYVWEEEDIIVLGTENDLRHFKVLKQLRGFSVL